MPLPRPLPAARRLTALALAAGLAAGCATGAADAPGDRAAGYPVTVASCDRQTTYDRPPSRAVAVDINMVEQVLALGLADRMVGTAAVHDADLVRPDLRPAFDRVPRLSGRYLEREPLLGAAPDFLYAGWNYGLSEASQLTPAALAEHGVDVYELSESCAHVLAGKRAPSLDEVWRDLTHLGAIFGVPQRAAALVGQQRAQLAAVDTRVVGRRPVPVFVYDSGEDAPFTAPGLAMPNELLRRAGGANIFADLARTWGEVSWEQVLAREPACVLIVDYDQPWQRKRDFLRRHPALRKLPAVRDDCVLPLPYAALTPGVRNADAVRQLADWLHPARPRTPGAR